MLIRHIPKVAIYGSTVGDLTAEFTNINGSITNDSNLVEIGEVLGRLFSLLATVNQTYELMAFGELQELHDYLKLIAKQRASLNKAAQRLTQRGVTLPNIYDIDQVISLSRNPDQYDTDITGWLRSLPTNQPELKLAAVIYELGMVDEEEFSQWAYVDEVLMEADELVDHIQNAIIELEQKQRELEESGFMEEDPDIAGEIYFNEDEF